MKYVKFAYFRQAYYTEWPTKVSHYQMIKKLY